MQLLQSFQNLPLQVGIAHARVEANNSWIFSGLNPITGMKCMMAIMPLLPCIKSDWDRSWRTVNQGLALTEKKLYRMASLSPHAMSMVWKPKGSEKSPMLRPLSCRVRAAAGAASTMPHSNHRRLATCITVTGPY